MLCKRRRGGMGLQLQIPMARGRSGSTPLRQKLFFPREEWASDKGVFRRPAMVLQGICLFPVLSKAGQGRRAQYFGTDGSPLKVHLASDFDSMYYWAC